MKTGSVWRAVRQCCINVYLGPLDLVNYDAWKQFVVNVLQSNAELIHVDTKCVVIEEPSSMTYVKHYHTPNRHVTRIATGESLKLDAETALQITVKSVSGSTGPDRVVKTFLVYGDPSHWSIPHDKPRPLLISAVTLKMPRKCRSSSQGRRPHRPCGSRMGQIPPTYRECP